MRLRATRRKGLSLLEVIVAMAVFLFSLVSLGYLLGMAGTLALDGHHKSEAASLARSKLSEVVVGAVPLESQSGVSFDEDPDYTWSLQADQASTSGLYNVTVTVSRVRPDGKTISSSLSQMVLDPTIVGSVFDTNPSVTDSIDTSASSGGGSSAGSTPSGSASTSKSGSTASASKAGSTTKTGAGTSSKTTGTTKTMGTTGGTTKTTGTTGGTTKTTGTTTGGTTKTTGTTGGTTTGGTKTTGGTTTGGTSKTGG